MPETTTYPTSENVSLLICDSAREEAHGKMSLLGFFPGNEIRVLSSIPLPVAFPISFVFILNDGAGVYDVGLEVIAPSGNVVLSVRPGAFTKEPQKQGTINFNLPLGFSVDSTGSYTIKLLLNDTTYSKSIKIIQ